ncbi:MAG: hypothetical protein MJZ40_04355 [Bacteroidaceae bacterium]|nr:hypothetical protein [Bacteroidaceae bacterium]
MPQLPELYTKAELDEIIEWFKARMDALPQDLTIAPGVTTKELPAVVTRYFDIIALHKENPTYTGQISHLFKIREVLIQQGMA